MVRKRSGSVEVVHTPDEVLGPEWARCPDRTPRRVESQYAVSELARRAGVSLVICEAAVGHRLPAHAERRRISGAIASWREGSRIVVFTDAARSAFVWTRALPTRFDGVRWVEYRTPPRIAAVRRELSRLTIRPDAPSIAEETAEDRNEVVRVLCSKLLPGRPGTAAGVQALVDHVVGSEDVGKIRRLWRTIGEISLLDLDCGSGEWLGAAAEVLEPIYLACLDRMRSFVDDAAAAGDGRRPEFLSDLRSIVEAAEDDRQNDGPEEYVRRLLVQRNLYGVAKGRGDLRATGERLARYARRRRGRGVGEKVVDANIVLLRGATGAAVRARVRAGRVGGRAVRVWERSDLGEAAEILSQTAMMLRAKREAREGSREVRSGMESLRRRRDALLTRMEVAIRRGDIDPHPSLVLNAALLRPAPASFDLVRREE
ncbi:MAG: hypothetical protein WD766_01645 [Gemmatimonadota bacterium]